MSGYRISGTSITLHPEWRYDFNQKRNPYKGFDRDPMPLPPSQTNRIRSEMFGWPVIGTLMKSHYMAEALDQYLSQYGMTWADVDPLKVNQLFGSQSGAYMYVSKNLMSLYR